MAKKKYCQAPKLISFSMGRVPEWSGNTIDLPREESDTIH
jgi:hypothetical protein